MSLPVWGPVLPGCRARESRLVVSTASAWELFTKHRIGKLPGADPWLDALEDHVARLGAAGAP